MYEHQYLELCKRILHSGTPVYNERTGKTCYTVIDVNFEYDRLPILTTKRVAWKPAIAELLGYLKGYSSAKDFRELGCKTWDANANDNQSWLNNTNRKGEDDMGRVYGVQGRQWGGYLDQLKKVIDNLKDGIDDRGEIITFWNPGEFHLGCLRPCMHTHTFSLLGDTLYLTSYQRSADVPLGLPFNMIQCWILLNIMASATGHKVGKVYHKIINAHIYSDQMEGIEEQLTRSIIKCEPFLHMWYKPESLYDIDNFLELCDFTVYDYESHPSIKFPFSV